MTLHRCPPMANADGNQHPRNSHSVWGYEFGACDAVTLMLSTVYLPDVWECFEQPNVAFIIDCALPEKEELRIVWN